MSNPSGRGRQVPRRAVLRTLGTALGSAAVMGFPGRAHAGAGEPEADATVASVEPAVVERYSDGLVTARVDSTGETVRVAARDFPDDWDFPEGSRVAVVDEPGGRPAFVLPLIVMSPPSRPRMVGRDVVAFGDMRGELTCESARAAVRAAIASGARGRAEAYRGVFVENARSGELIAAGVLER